jgi:uncharacterized tellurite resistance protein B-like protein
MSDRADEQHLEPSPALRAELARNQELKHHARNFLLAGGLMAGHSDGELSAEEQEYLLGVLAGLFDDPGGAVDRLDSPAVAIELLESSMTWLEQHGGAHRVELFRHLAAIVAVDGVLDPNELRYMQNVAERLGIPQTDARAALEQELTGADGPH